MKDDKVFLDTNVLIYAYTVSVERKHKIAMEIMDDLWHTGLGVLSTQVLQEFFVVVTKKIPNPLDARTAGEIVKDLLAWNVVVNDGEGILRAIEIHQRDKYSFWDSMILQAALQGNAGVLLSEDLSDGQSINGMKIRNPFS